MKKVLLSLLVISLAFSVCAEEYKADAKITVIGKRLPTKYGLRTATLPYIVYIGGESAVNRTSRQTASEMMARQDGLHQFNLAGNELDQLLLMRGFSEGTEVAAYVDGVKYNAEDETLYWYWLPIESISRYELLKGADSSVYGSGGFAGTIHLYRKKHLFTDPYSNISTLLPIYFFLYILSHIKRPFVTHHHLLSYIF